MKSIHVSASRAYDVLIERGLLSRLGELTKANAGGTACALVSDDAVYSLYGERAKQSLEGAGYRVLPFVFPHGEASKTLDTYGRLLNFLCEHHLTRTDPVLALGGGVVGDLAGFAAATYLRGVPFVQAPTTLLAMVDSSVGGKTAVDLPGGKNQAGCFYQPHLVVCDPDTLSTLPEEQYRCGCAEVIKYAVLGGEPLFGELETTPVRAQEEHVIATCVTMKRDVVREDEFDRGARALLNLGHTVGHAIESVSGFSTLHGQAVAAGLAIIARAAAKKGCCPEKDAERIVKLLAKYGLPTGAEYPAEPLFQAAMSDKKKEGATLRLTVPEQIGRCREERIPAAELLDWMRAGGVA